MRRSRSSSKKQPLDESPKWNKPVSAGSSLPFYGCWASSVDYIKSLQTLSQRLESLELPKVAGSYSQKLVSEGRIPEDFFERTMHARNSESAQESRAVAVSTLAATELLANALAKNSPQEHIKMPRSPYESPKGLKTANADNRHSPSLSPSVIRFLQSPPSSQTGENSGRVSADFFLPYTSEKLDSPNHELEIDHPGRGFSAKSGSSNISRNFSASECSMFYSPSRCSGLSSSTNRSTVSNFKLPSVCMMSEYSAENFQNRVLGKSSRLRRLKHADYAISKSTSELFIETNGASRSCMLASQKKHSNLRSACPPGTVIAKNDLSKYCRLRHCDPNLASRELGLALHTTIHVQEAMRKQHGE